MSRFEPHLNHLTEVPLPNREIAGALGIAERTVRFHVANIFAKLRVSDRRRLLAALEKVRFEPA